MVVDFFHFPISKATVLLGKLKDLELVYTLAIVCVSPQHVIVEFYCGTLYKQVYDILNYVQSIQFATRGPQSSSKVISRKK